MEIKRILVSRTDKIGDLILSIPSFFMIKKMYPNAELVAIVRKYNMDIVKNLPYIDRFVILDDYTKAELLEKIAYFKADVFIALYNDAYIAALARASKAKIRIGPISKLSSFFTYNKGVLQKRSLSIKNEGQYNLDLVAKLDKERYDEIYSKVLEEAAEPLDKQQYLSLSYQIINLNREHHNKMKETYLKTLEQDNYSNNWNYFWKI